VMTLGTGSFEARSKPTKFFRGFTLIEILLVIMIIGLVAGIAAINFDSSSKNLKDKAINLLLIEGVFNARLYAREHRVPTHLSYDQENAELMITTVTGLSLEKINCKYEGQENPKILFHPLKSTEYTGGSSFVYFDPSGESSFIEVEIESDHFKGTIKLDAFATMELPKPEEN
jgi:prepilin-type N-terminal cleavage/methylation domain-containing protein